MEYRFKEIKELDKLVPFLQLRYAAYKASINSNLLKTNTEKLDMDIFDLRSRHFGLYEAIGKKKQLAM